MTSGTDSTVSPPAYPWAGGSDPSYARYMEEEWGIPVHDERKLFEMLILEVFQAGLSWATILKRRAGFRKAFAGWNIRKVAAFGESDVERLMQDSGIIRNRLKIRAAINNANRFLEIEREFGSFDAYLWAFTARKTLRPRKPYKRWEDIPSETPLAREIGKDLRKRGFRFMGPVATYAFMQAVGLVDDHPGRRKA